MTLISEGRQHCVRISTITTYPVMSKASTTNKLTTKGLPPMRAEGEQKRGKQHSKKKRLDNTAVDPMGYILITVNGSMGPRGGCFWPFRVGGV